MKLFFGTTSYFCALLIDLSWLIFTPFFRVTFILRPIKKVQVTTRSREHINHFTVKTLLEKSEKAKVSLDVLYCKPLLPAWAWYLRMYKSYVLYITLFHWIMTAIKSQGYSLPFKCCYTGAGYGKPFTVETEKGLNIFVKTEFSRSRNYVQQRWQTPKRLHYSQVC